MPTTETPPRRPPAELPDCLAALDAPEARCLFGPLSLLDGESWGVARFYLTGRATAHRSPDGLTAEHRALLNALLEPLAAAVDQHRRLRAIGSLRKAAEAERQYGSGRASGERLSTLDEAMRRHIRAALRACLGRIEGPSGAARLLGVNPHTLRGKMRRLGIDWKIFRPSRG